MGENNFFKRNILALSQTNPELCSRLSGVMRNFKRYAFLDSRSGEKIPALTDPSDPSGASHALHSVMDPRREAKRLIDTVENEGFLVFLGLGGGFYAEAALEKDIGMALAIEFGLEGFAELLCHRDYSRLFSNPRFRLLLDKTKTEIEQDVLNLYQPVLYGGIRVIPLRPRTRVEPAPFVMAANAIEAAINKVSSDYSVQAHFGKRWFSNIVRNIKNAGVIEDELPRIKKAAVCAAGPSLSARLPMLRGMGGKRRDSLFLIAVDTSLPCLLHAGIIPDAVISIDCQHISYHHFMSGLPEETLLFLDLASPPLLAGLSKRRHFFTGGHPLTRYISQAWKPFPELDATGGNVTYAAVSLAEQLGADEIELYGADFSYPAGVTYARGAYIYLLFEKRQNRLDPLEALASAFLYRTALEKIRNREWYYETKTLKTYRERLEEKSGRMEARIIPVEGPGAPINISRAGKPERREGKQDRVFFAAGKTGMKAEKFLYRYRDEIARLPVGGKNAAEYPYSLHGEARAVFTTLLPAAAAIKRRNAGASFSELVEETKIYCLAEIDAVLSAKPVL